MNKSPGQGGCWFCQNDDDKSDLFYEPEWDTMVHISCLKKALKNNPNHPEAVMMRHLLDDGKTD